MEKTCFSSGQVLKLANSLQDAVGLRTYFDKALHHCLLYDHELEECEQVLVKHCTPESLGFCLPQGTIEMPGLKNLVTICACLQALICPGLEAEVLRRYWQTASCPAPCMEESTYSGFAPSCHILCQSVVPLKMDMQSCKHSLQPLLTSLASTSQASFYRHISMFWSRPRANYTSCVSVLILYPLHSLGVLRLKPLQQSGVLKATLVMNKDNPKH